MEYSQTFYKSDYYKGTNRLNPYSNGILTDYTKSVNLTNGVSVLILILMEYSQTLFAGTLLVVEVS